MAIEPFLSPTPFGPGFSYGAWIRLFQYYGLGCKFSNAQLVPYRLTQQKERFSGVDFFGSLALFCLKKPQF
jgi:hypothetical protein